MVAICCHVNCECTLSYALLARKHQKATKTKATNVAKHCSENGVVLVPWLIEGKRLYLCVHLCTWDLAWLHQGVCQAGHVWLSTDSIGLYMHLISVTSGRQPQVHIRTNYNTEFFLNTSQQENVLLQEQQWQGKILLGCILKGIACSKRNP